MSALDVEVEPQTLYRFYDGAGEENLSDVIRAALEAYVKEES